MTTSKTFGTGADVFTGVWWDQYVITDAGGNDRFTLGDQGDLVWAGAGDDYVFGAGGNDMIEGQAGHDVLYGANGDDQLVGGTGNDKLYGGDGNDKLFGGDDDDRLEGYNGHDQLDGGAGADVLVGAGGFDILKGGSGNDTLFGGDGVNAIDGGSGVDTLRLNESFDHVMPSMYGYLADVPLAHVDLQAGFANIVGQYDSDVYVTNSVVNVENVFGTNNRGVSEHTGFSDVMRGNGSNNVFDALGGNDLLEGRGGNDTLSGGSDNDLLIGGSGVDQLWGGQGNDIFHFDDWDSGTYVPGSRTPITSDRADTIHDFESGVDLIDLSSWDANTIVGGDQNFTLVTSFTGVAGQIRIAETAQGKAIYGDVNGDAYPDFGIEVLGAAALVSTDVIL